jgi:hypothetical protein
MGVVNRIPIVTNGLVLNLDAGNYKSYPKSGTIWTDLSVSRNSGTLTNGPIYNPENGGNIVFDGVNDYVTLGNPSSLDILNFTICAWAKSSTFTNYQNIIFKGNSSGVQYGIGLDAAGQWSVQPNSAAISDTLTLNTWNFFVGTYDGTQIRAYRNAILKEQYNIAQTSYSSIVTIGADTVNSRYFNGSIPLVQIYNRALSASEISQNYMALKSRFGL